MAATKKLHIKHDYNFIVLGISCHEKPYRLCWALNNQLQSAFSKDNDIELVEKGRREKTLFPVFSFHDESKITSYKVIANKTNNKLLVTEYKQADYLLIIQGEAAYIEKNSVIKKINEVGFIQTAFEIPVEKIKSKDLFIF